MKTRREFFKTLAGSMAVVAACVVAPKSLMAMPDEEAILKSNNPWMKIPSSHTHKGYKTVTTFTHSTAGGWTVHKGA